MITVLVYIFLYHVMLGGSHKQQSISRVRSFTFSAWESAVLAFPFNFNAKAHLLALQLASGLGL